MPNLPSKQIDEIESDDPICDRLHHALQWCNQRKMERKESRFKKRLISRQGVVEQHCQGHSQQRVEA